MEKAIFGQTLIIPDKSINARLKERRKEKLMWSFLLMVPIVMPWDYEHQANVVEFQMERVSEAMNKMLMIAFGMYFKEAWRPHWLASNERTERHSSARERSKIHGRMQ